MAWSIYQTGKPVEVKAALVPQFAQATQQIGNNPHELASLGLIEQAANGELDFLSQFDNVEVQMTAEGDAEMHTDPDGKKRGHSQLSLSIITTLP